MPISDVSQSATTFPDEIVVDASVLFAIAVLAAPGITAEPKDRFQHQRVAPFVQVVGAGRTTAFATPTAVNETVHLFTTLYLKRDVRQLKAHARSGNVGDAPPKDAYDLMKQEPWRIQSYEPSLATVLAFIEQAGFVFVSFHELTWQRADRWHERLLRTMGRYQQFSNDAMLLMDAQRLGVSNVITLDRDFERAASDFTIYTWR